MHAGARLGSGHADDAAVVAADRGRRELDASAHSRMRMSTNVLLYRTGDRKVIGVSLSRGLPRALEARDRFANVLRVDDAVHHHVAAGEVLVRPAAAGAAVLEASISCSPGTCAITHAWRAT